jgi:hypothetical protein
VDELIEVGLSALHGRQMASPYVFGSDLESALDSFQVFVIGAPAGRQGDVIERGEILNSITDDAIIPPDLTKGWATLFTRSLIGDPTVLPERSVGGANHLPLTMRIQDKHHSRRLPREVLLRMTDDDQHYAP